MCQVLSKTWRPALTEFAFSWEKSGEIFKKEQIINKKMFAINKHSEEL